MAVLEERPDGFDLLISDMVMPGEIDVWALAKMARQALAEACDPADDGGDMTMAMPPKGAADLVLLLVMWWIMMIGMMLPSAAPMILTFATVNANRRARAQPWVPTALFAAGYVLAWGGFSIAATLAQWGLESAALVSPMAMSVTSARLGGVLFLAAGLYQLTPLKHACLIACRSPFDFVVNRWRDGAVGALRMGRSTAFPASAAAGS